MQHVRSADGTAIALTRIGDGDPVVVVGGAFSTAADAEPIALALAAAGFAAVAWDRRARGDSGDTRPYAPEREVEDLHAVVESVGGPVTVVGHSSGAVLALFAAAQGVSVRRLVLSEPPFRFGVDEPAADLPERLQAFVDAGAPEDAVTTFQREGVGLPDAVVEQIRRSPMFAGLVPLAQSVVYDATLVRAVSTPTAAMTSVDVPVAILLGRETFPVLEAAAERLGVAMPAARTILVPESSGHRMDPAGTARVLLELG